MDRADSPNITPAPAPSRRGLLKGTAAAVAAVATGASPALSAQSPVSPLASEFRGLVAEANKAFELSDVVPSSPESLAAETRYQEIEAEISAVLRRIWAHPAHTWDDVTLRAEAAAYLSEYGPVHGGSGHDPPDHERSLDELINAVLAVARAN